MHLPALRRRRESKRLKMAKRGWWMEKITVLPFSASLGGGLWGRIVFVEEGVGYGGVKVGYGGGGAKGG